MGSTKIEYLDATWNFLTGCYNWKDPAICGGGGSEFKCWAKSMAERFWPNDFHPRFNPDKVSEPIYRKKPSRIGVCFTGDLFQDCVDPDNLFSEALYCHGGPLPYGADTGYIFDIIKRCPQHQFFFLTKCPWNLAKWGRFPDNAWVGVSVTDDVKLTKAFVPLKEVQAAHRWLSIEPLLKWDMSVEDTAWTFGEMGIDWVVIGGLSNVPAERQPKPELIKTIVMAADNAGIPVFLKNNLSPLSGTLSTWQGFHRQRGPGQCWTLRQELPEFHMKATPCHA